MLRNLPIALQGIILVSVPLLCELVFVGTLSWHLNIAVGQLQQVERAREFRQTTDEMVQTIYNVAHDLKGVRFDNLMSVDFQEVVPRLDRQLYEPIVRVEQQVDKLESISFDQHQLDNVKAIHRKFHRLSKVIAMMRDAMQHDDRLRLLAIGDLITRELDALKADGGMFDLIDSMIQNEHYVEQNYEKKFIEELPATYHKITVILIVGVIGNIAVALFLVGFFNSDTAHRFRLLMDNTRRLAAGKPLNPPIPGSGEIAHLDRVFNDMARALDAARRKERAIIENALDVICSYDEYGKFTAMSPACESLFGYTSEELLGQTYTAILLPEDVGPTGAAVARIVEGELRGQFENRVKRKDGSIVDVLWALQWSPAERSMFCVAHDITERKNIERMKQEFVAMVSHDLRTPLTSIQGFLTLLSTGMYGELSENGSGNLRLAESNIGRLIRLINDLLDIEKMESGKLKMEMKDTELSDVFERSLAAVVGFAEQQLVNIVAKPTDLRAHADPERLIQVVVNLASNAIKFSPKGSTVTIEAESNPQYIEVRVIDQGRGVPAEFRESIFERFQQVKDSDSRVKVGSGLGLAICKAIVEGHEGTIGVDSEEGKGSTFWFRVPHARAAGANSAAVKAETATIEQHQSVSN